MKMFGKVDIGDGVSDFWSYIRAPRAHRWPLWGVALALTYVVFNGFSQYLFPVEPPKQQIVYVDNWAATRSSAEERADWVERAKETTRKNALRRAEYQKLAKMLGVDYDSSEADQVTQETLGSDAEKAKRPEPVRSTLAERAAGKAAAPPAAE
jgi:hypothetical protein